MAHPAAADAAVIVVAARGAVLPRNPGGDRLKRALREPYWDGADRRIG